MSSVPTSQSLGERQLAIYLKERGVDCKSIPAEALRKIVETAEASMDLLSLSNSQALVLYMGRIRLYSEVVVDYCTKPAVDRKITDQAIHDILGAHGVLAKE